MHRLPLILSLLALSPLARAESTILLQSHVGQAPADARHYVEFLVRTLGEHAPLAGEALAKEIEGRLSVSAGELVAPEGLRAQVEEGRRYFIEGEFNRAIASLEEARSMLLRQAAVVASDQSLRDSLHKALLFLAHAYLRTDQGESATTRISEVIRGFPDRDLSLVQHGPDLVRLYKNVRAELDRQQRGILEVTTTPPGCLVFVNERFVGLSPARIADLYPGRYRVYVQRPREQGRVHLVTVAGGEHAVQVDFGLDSALRSEPFVGLLYASDKDKDAREVEHAATVARSLDAERALVLGFRRYQGRRSLQGTTISAATGKTIRSAMVALEPASPSPETLKALGRFLIAGEGGAGIIIQTASGSSDAGVAATSPARPGAASGSGFFSARVFKWITLGLGVAGLASGITLMVLDGRGTCDAQDARCPEKYETLLPGIILTGVGGAALATGGFLFYWDARGGKASRAATLVPWVGQGLGLSGLLVF